MGLEPGAQYVPGSAVVVVYDRDAGILWYVDETTGALKTQINHLCLHQRQGSLARDFFADIAIARLYTIHR